MKNVKISLIRMIAMLMIITCHILQGIGNSWAFWVNVGVQIFFFISGYLYGAREIDDVKKFYKSRIKKILLPYSIIAILIFALERFILSKKYSIKLMIGSVLGFGAFNNNSPILSHTWFVSYILICYLITPILQKIFTNKDFNKNIKNLILTTVFIQILQTFSVININGAWINNFVFGYFYTKSCNDAKKQKCIKIILLGAFVVIMPFAIIYQEAINISLPYQLNKLSNYIIDYGHVLLGIVLFMILYKLIDLIKIKYNCILKFSDKYSYYIYLVHQIFILNSFSLLFITKYLTINILIILVVSIVSGIILKITCDLVIKAIGQVSKFRMLNTLKN